MPVFAVPSLAIAIRPRRRHQALAQYSRVDAAACDASSTYGRSISLAVAKLVDSTALRGWVRVKKLNVLLRSGTGLPRTH